MVCVRGEAHVQHTPAHVPGLHRSPQVKSPPGGVVQADVLVCREHKYSIPLKQLECEGLLGQMYCFQARKWVT